MDGTSRPTGCKYRRGKGLGRHLPSPTAVSVKRIEKCCGTDDHTPHQGMGAKPVVSLPRAQNGIDIAYCSNG